MAKVTCKSKRFYRDPTHSTVFFTQQQPLGQRQSMTPNTLQPSSLACVMSVAQRSRHPWEEGFSVKEYLLPLPLPSVPPHLGSGGSRSSKLLPVFQKPKKTYAHLQRSCSGKPAVCQAWNEPYRSEPLISILQTLISQR